MPFGPALAYQPLQPRASEADDDTALFSFAVHCVFFRDANCLAARGAIIKENEHRKLMNQGFLLRYP